ncbi:MAG: hypothetical protein ACOYXB_06505 [Bacteroidota bacterium]
MKTTNRSLAVLMILLLIISVSCKKSLELPSSAHAERIGSYLSLRYAFVKYENGRLSCNGKEIKDLKSFRADIFNYIECYNGSNFFRIAFICPKSVNYATIDSILNAFRDGGFPGIVFLTNEIDDSAGIVYTLPPLELPSFFFKFDTLSPDILDFTICGQSIFIDDSVYSGKALQEKLGAIIGSDSLYLQIRLNSKNNYQDLISLLDSYYVEYERYLNDLSFIHFQKEYRDLKWYERSRLKELTKHKGIGIRLKFVNEDTKESSYR